MAESSHIPNVVLVGYRGCGKTTVGRILADRLGRPFVDTDACIVERAGKSVAAIFRDHGESAFRDWESEVIRGVCAAGNQVVSVGGGAVLRDENVRMLREGGVVVWLRADAATLWSRIARDTASAAQRPALTRLSGVLEVRELLAEREPLYERAAHHAIEAAGADPVQVAERIEALLASI